MPSQNLRSILGRIRPARRGFATTLLLGAALALSACGNQSADAAAIVDGAVIGDNDVQSVSRQLTELAQGQQKFSSRDVMLALIAAPYVKVVADRTGKSPTDAEVQQVIAKVETPSHSTVDYVRMVLAFQKLDDANKADVLSDIGNAEININPRYGTLDRKQFTLLPGSPNWMKAGATPDAK